MISEYRGVIRSRTAGFFSFILLDGLPYAYVGLMRIPVETRPSRQHVWFGVMGDLMRGAKGWDMEQGGRRRVNGWDIQLVQHNAAVDMGGEVGIVRDKDDRPRFFLTA